MFALFDQISATMVHGSVVLIILATLALSRDANVDSLRAYAGRVHMMDLVEVIDRDLRNVGTNVADGDAALVSYQWDDEVRTFTFAGVADTTTANPVQIRYSLVEADSIESDASGEMRWVTLYELERSINSGSGFELTGGSLPVITDMSIVLRDDNENVLTCGLNATRSIEVGISMISSLGENSAVKRVNWQSRFEPLNLWIRSN